MDISFILGRLNFKTVVAIYKQGGRKTAYHARVSDCNGIRKSSYVAVQLYEQLGNGHFTDQPREMAHFILGVLLTSPHLTFFAVAPLDSKA